MAKGLTTKQQQILDYIQDYVRNEGFPPSIREIGKVFDIGSLRGVTVHLDALVRKGYISRSNTPRSIKVVHADPRPSYSEFIARLPMLGSVKAGPDGSLTNGFAEETVDVPLSMLKGVSEAFVLTVKGDSMVDFGILEGDLIIVKPQATALQNDLVVAVIDDEPTVKQFDLSQRSGPRLLPGNAAYSPIPLAQEGTSILGKVVSSYRIY